jgi:hypothetical protein
MSLLKTLILVLFARSGYAFTAIESQRFSSSCLSPTMCTVSSYSLSTTALLAFKTSLQYKQKSEDELLYTNSLSEDLMKEVARPTIRSMYLPRQRSVTSSQEKLFKVEMVLGRLAMIASIMMIGADLIAGTSLPEQFIDFF